MLHSLHIQNYALIQQLEINFSNQLTIITGETGAGKSILLGALGLLLGERADSDVLFDKEKKCVVEGNFLIENLGLEDFFKENEIDFDTHCIIRREITANGKSRAFINDTPVNLTALKQLSEELIDVHRQHETLSLNSSKFQLVMLDALAGNEILLAAYQQQFKNYQQKQNRLSALKTEQEQLLRNLDYFQFQFKELSEAKLIGNELTELESELQLLENADNIKSTLQQAFQGLSESDEAITSQLKNIISQVNSIKNLKPEIAELHQRLNSAALEIKDIADEIDSLNQHINTAAERMQIVSERIDLLNRLMKKHNAANDDELLQIQNDFEQKIKAIEIGNDEIESIEKEISTLHQNLLTKAKSLSNKRLQAATPFEKNVNELLHEVGMPHALLKIEHHALQEINQTGSDNFKFLFTANKGSALQEISKVASGGELSRLMLCIKSLVAASTHLPTLVFDEIDTGISGEVAMQVGKVLQQLASSHQVLCITHLPQIAAKGNAHYFVYKTTSGERTLSQIKSLNEHERIVEIAKMLSGNQPGEAAMANAKELLN